MQKHKSIKIFILITVIVFIASFAYIIIQESVKKPSYNYDATPFGQEVETKGEKIRKEIEERTKQEWPKKCNPNGKLGLVDKANYKFQSALNYDPDMKFDANEMKVYGLLKNNSTNCYATNIKIEISLVNESGDIMQKEKYTFLPSITDYEVATSKKRLNEITGVYTQDSQSIKINFYDLTISPNSVKEFSNIIKVYESLTVGMGERLKFGIKPQIKIISIEWVSS